MEISLLATDQMREVVDGYATHFFNLAYSLVVLEKEQPPRSLHNKLRSTTTNMYKLETLIFPGGGANNNTVTATKQSKINKEEEVIISSL